MIQPLIVIPARIGSTRLKNKPLRKIAGVPLVTHVCLRALEADIGTVLLSTDDERVALCAPRGVKTSVCSTIIERCGSDRVAWAAEVHDDGFTHVINLQGDMPFIEPALIQAVWHRRHHAKSDVVTANHGLEYVHWSDAFYREVALQHIGIYAFTVGSLKRFAMCEPSTTELHWKLEGCRMTSNDMTIETVNWPSMPLEINTESDLEHANAIAEAIWRSDDARPRHPRPITIAGSAHQWDWPDHRDSDIGPD